MRLGKLLFVLALPLTLCGCRNEEAIMDEENYKIFHTWYSQLYETVPTKSGFTINITDFNIDDEGGTWDNHDHTQYFFTDKAYNGFEGVFYENIYKDRSSKTFAHGSLNGGAIKDFKLDSNTAYQVDSTVDFDIDNDHQGNGYVIGRFKSFLVDPNRITKDQIELLKDEYDNYLLTIDEMEYHIQIRGLYVGMFYITKFEDGKHVGMIVDNFFKSNDSSELPQRFDYPFATR